MDITVSVLLIISHVKILQLSEGVQQHLHIVINVADQIFDLQLGVEHLDVLGVGVVAHSERSGDGGSKFPRNKLRKHTHKIHFQIPAYAKKFLNL